MIYLITGDLDSGKTTKMREIYRGAVPGSGDGFVSRKIYQGSEGCIGYELERLSSGEKHGLVRLASHYNDDFDEAFRYDRFIFSQAGFCFGESIIEELLLDENIQDIYIDEIGPVELKGQGFCSILHKALQSDKNIYLTVRSKCLQEVIEKFLGTAQHIFF